MELCERGLKLPNYLWISSGLRYILIEDNLKEKTTTTTPSRTLRKTRPLNIFGIPPYRYVFTYSKLFLDIPQFNKRENQRVSLFKKILIALKWDKGYVFVPCESFWENINELIKDGHNITHILVFGKEAKNILMPDISLKIPYGVERYNNFTAIFLPSPEEMLPDNREAKNIVWHFLKDLRPPK